MRYRNFLVGIASICIYTLLVAARPAVAEVIDQDGGGGSGSGRVDLCSTSYHGIHDAICNGGRDGGGKSWRIYKIIYYEEEDDDGNVVIKSDTTMANIDNDAAWKIHNGGKCAACGDAVTILPECKEKKAPFIALFGVNTSVVGGGNKKFYVSYNRASGRGTYYRWNTYDAVPLDNIANAYNGQTMKNSTAKALYANNNNGSAAGFKSKGAFCVVNSAVNAFTLNAYAVDENSGELLNGGPIDDDSYSAGETASVDNLGWEFDGYTWHMWDINGRICPNNPGRECAHADMPGGNTAVNAYYLRNRFAGITSISGTRSDSTNWANYQSNQTKQVRLGNCASGCSVNFNHQMKTEQGSGSTSYTIKRVSNTSSISSGTVASGSFSGGQSSVRNSGTMTLYTGMVVCETLSFTAEPVSGKGAYSQICAIADAPADSSINAQVRNPDAASTYHNWQDAVYAKPDNIVDFKSWYNPNTQAIANLTANYINGAYVGTKALKAHGGWNNGYDVAYKQTYKGASVNYGLHPNLAYKIQGTVGSTKTLSKEQSGKEYGEREGRKITANDVGTELSEIAQTNNLIKTVPFRVTFGVQGGADLSINATIDWRSISKKASVYTPYNFTTETEVTTKGGELDPDTGNPKNPIYAGEESHIDYKIIISDKPNSVTTDDGSSYVTRADDVRTELVIYNPDQISNPNSKKPGGTINVGRDANPCTFFTSTLGNDSICGTTNYREDDYEPGEHPIGRDDSSSTFNVPDLPAGSQICVAVAVFPSSSGADTNWNNLNYDSKWRISKSECYSVAKRPNLQAWGGNVYSGSNINAPRSVKNNLAGYTGYSAKNPQGTFVFGSWGELGVVSQGKVTGFASGATLGYHDKLTLDFIPTPFADNLLLAVPDPGGSRTSDFCKHSVLTFANSGCKGTNGVADGIGGNGTTDSIRLNLDAISALADNSISVKDISGQSTFNIVTGVGSTADDGTMLYKGSGNLTVTSEDLIRSTFKIVSADNITIASNIKISDDPALKNLNTFRQAPKVVLYARDTIYINCDVTRLDAVLVAGNQVITCNNLDSSNEHGLANKIKAKINSRDNAKSQLRVNGAIIAKKLYANRTHGAGAGVNSIVPAEIIDFDPTLYLWGGSAGVRGGEESKGATNGNMEVTYIHEVAPRY